MEKSKSCSDRKVPRASLWRLICLPVDLVCLCPLMAPNALRWIQNCRLHNRNIPPEIVSSDLPERSQPEVLKINTITFEPHEPLIATNFSDVSSLLLVLPPGWWMSGVRGQSGGSGSTALRMSPPSCFLWLWVSTTRSWWSPTTR